MPSIYIASNTSGTADAQDRCWPAIDTTLFPKAIITSGIYKALYINDYKIG